MKLLASHMIPAEQTMAGERMRLAVYAPTEGDVFDSVEIAMERVALTNFDRVLTTLQKLDLDLEELDWLASVLPAVREAKVAHDAWNNTATVSVSDASAKSYIEDLEAEGL